MTETLKLDNATYAALTADFLRGHNFEALLFGCLEARGWRIDRALVVRKAVRYIARRTNG